MRRYVGPLRNLAWVISIISLVAMFYPIGASAADGNKVVFAYQQATISQDVNVSSVISAGSTLTATVSAAEVGCWN
jgi:hypothetical protein